jgi:hypothetical protein
VASQLGEAARTEAACSRRVRTARTISMSIVGAMQTLWADPSGSLYLFSGEQDGPVTMRSVFGSVTR